jgi:putative DNA primase/helicase
MRDVEAALSDQPTDNAALDRGLDDKDTIARLAKMGHLEYDRARKAEAERLGVSVTALDKAVEAKRGDGREESEGAGRAFTLEDPEPWPGTVSGAELLGGIAATVSRHIALGALAADAITLWALHAHAHDSASMSPILGLTSPAPECGKTTLLSLLGALVPRPLEASSITTSALFRAVERWRPTLLIDEADTFLGDNDELRGVLNSGHNRASAQVIRTVGDEHEPRAFRTWAPKAIALIGALPATLSSRSIHIEMKRLAPGERVEPLRADRLHHLEPLRRQAWRWAQDHALQLQRADPAMPTSLRGRAADNWRHLVAIADLAGGEWPARARRAAEALSAADSERAAGELLLEDIRAIFRGRGVDRLPSTELVQALGEMEHRPWPEWSKGKPITSRQVAKMLGSFGVPTNRTIRLTSGKTAKGYELHWFREAFARYLPEDPPSDRSHGNNPQKSAKNDLFHRSQAEADVTDGNGQNPRNSAPCDGVTDEIPPHEGNGAYEPGADLDADMDTTACLDDQATQPQRGDT